MKRIDFMLMLVIGFLFIACEHKELCDGVDGTIEVHVLFDWEHAPQAKPKSMRLYLFPLEGGMPLLYEFSNHTGGIVKLRAGRYKVLCYNSDTETIGFKNIENFEKFEAYALKGVLAVRGSSAPRATGTENERVALSPELLYTDRRTDVEINAVQPKQQLVLFPKQSVCRYRVEIKYTSYQKHILADGISGSLSALAGGIYIGSATQTPELVTVPFGIENSEVGTLKADFLTFGQLASSTNPHKLVVYVIMDDGSRRYYTFDVTEQVDNAPDPYDVYICIEKLPLPQPLSTEGGFQPEVDEWQDIHEDISM